MTALQKSHDDVAAAGWCSLACHNLFSSAGELNKAKLGRSVFGSGRHTDILTANSKMIMNAITSGNVSVAREAYYRMPESGKTAAMTNYLMYKLALRTGDADMGELWFS